MSQNQKSVTFIKKNRGLLSSTAVVLVAAAIVVIAVIIVFIRQSGPQGTSQAQDAVVDSDIVIPLSEVSETAGFYPAEINGIRLEVLAVKAPDGTIRTAFNTCQVCYDSGRGYYQQDGNVLVCQNCGNRFRMDQVEVVSGGCNPVPIFDENKTVDGTSITISADYLREATVIFSNWKSSY